MSGPDALAVMTAAELRIARERLGVTGEWLADRLGVAERSVRRWEHGTVPIPAGVAHHVLDLIEQTEQFVQQVVEQLRDDPRDDGGWRVVTFDSDAGYLAEHPETGWSAGWHRAAMGRVAEQLPGVRIRYLPTDAD